ncbi:hypothetical protein LTR99_007003 [Exophiala xenobiotica]|uniref:DUF7918 domain-containing protein n=1 Tax=Vermiconidia calcicola TaxID=1690605 RepID=A0AAV9PZD9_9PEZI|nr:hypothetical protein LTR96_005265 [Exophiala xenobiotica]KAK5532004.1 hypothetical protein LTR25_008334 [Vermiconidia calcicola]KAK5539473.1 hypothetical protein LTR23_006493 [Chaetothyriales sp. CCFEE 6169]KAK5300256.1 hypothetical protein LTR99_007003 [Exophiala xenobiotica]KAK5339487.1 hypothetical protein LTR98_004288 [Exophiala xenobiotica]
MPCFKGLAVSIHTPNGPLPEYSVQKASRLSRISAFIPVPPAKVPADSVTGKPEQSTFAISITLLTPSQEVPYSTPKSTPENPDPKPKLVGGLPGIGSERGKYTGTIGPYVPLTTSPNETIAAYIYFDGRAKEEVATLLRKGEETWVNSRWVSVPDKEGGGLAEREFLFREVGLERWLNGLDLDGKDAAATIERRRQKLEKKMEKRRRKRKETVGSDDEANGDSKGSRRKSTLRYGENGQVQDVSDDERSFSDSESSEEDDDPIPEAAGQIKVALFRVLASGEIKRGEYSPQFDAHDDSEESGGEAAAANGEGKNRADVDHTTSFAKPKTLDPKTISTQTVTGIDPTDKPYAVFTFLYRGERQLQKMGILSTPKSEKAPSSAKRRSIAAELPKLGPLKKEGAAGFSGFRDAGARRPQKSKRGSDDEMDSDSGDEHGGIIGKMEDINDADVKRDPTMLGPEDAERAGQVAEGIRKMKLKRQHSAEPLNSNGITEARKSSKSGSPSTASTPKIGGEELATSPGTSNLDNSAGPNLKQEEDESFMVGSPMKRQRASVAEFDADIQSRLTGGMPTSVEAISEVLGTSGQPQAASTSATPSGLQFGGTLQKPPATDDDEEL